LSNTTEKKFAKAEDWCESTTIGLKLFMTKMRRYYKYMSIANIINDDLINLCLKNMHVTMEEGLGGKLEPYNMAILYKRIEYTPTIMALLKTSMVDERSLLLKNIKRELRSKSEIQIGSFLRFAT
jgi:hypothetical protein